MARHWNPIMMNAVLFGRIAMLHENRATLGLTASRCGSWSAPTPASTAPAPGSTEEAKKRMAEINERLAHLGTSFSHHLLGRRAGLVRWSSARATAPGCPTVSSPPPGRRREERGMAGKAIVTLSRSSVEPFLQSLGAARPAREGLQGLDRPRRQWQRQRQQRRSSPRCWRCATRARGCSAIRPSPHYRLDDSMAKTPDAVRGLLERVWKPARAACARRPRRDAGGDRGGGRQFRARALGLALLRREAAAGRVPISTTPRSSRTSRSTT